MQTNNSLSDRIAYITINPSGKFLKSAQIGFKDVGLFPKFIIHVNPKGRIKKEFKKYRFAILTRFLLPKFQQHAGNNKSFSDEIIDINIPIRKSVSTLNSEETIQFIKDNNIKYLINCGAGIFRKSITDIDGLFIFNAHAGKLPEYRNMNVVEWALLNNDAVIGTVHLIDSGIDTGPILHEELLDLTGKNNIIDARETAFDQVIRLVGKTILLFENGKISSQKQPKDGKKWYVMHDFFRSKLNNKLNKSYCSS
jgi:phosphoribosylglycinamide formyltransferase-1